MLRKALLLVACTLVLDPTCTVVFAQNSNPEVACSMKNDLNVYRELMSPETVKDAFGTRIAEQFLVFQVTISNKCRNHQFLIHDLSLDLTDVLPPETLTKLEALEQREHGNGRYEMSSQELSIVRGVAEKGQTLSTRNLLLRLLRAAGTIGAGLIGVTSFGASYAPSIAVFNGPALTAYSEAFPDFTVNELIRIQDSAYIANTLVPKEQAKVVAVFLPQKMFLSKENRKKFNSEPTSILTGFDYRLIHVVVDGSFIIEVPEQVPLPTMAVVPAGEMEKFRNGGAEVTGFIIGRGLADAEIALNTPLQGTSVSTTDSSSDSKLVFKMHLDQPVPSGTALQLEVANKQGSRQTVLRVAYPAARAALPALASVNPDNGTRGQAVTVTLNGSNFVAGATITVSGIGITVSNINIVNDTEITATINIGANATTGPRNVTIRTAGGTTQPVTFTVN